MSFAVWYVRPLMLSGASGAVVPLGRNCRTACIMERYALMVCAVGMSWSVQGGGGDASGTAFASFLRLRGLR